MTEAERIARELEDRRHRLMMRKVVLSDQMLPLAFDIVVHNRARSRQAERRRITHQRASPTFSLSLHAATAEHPNFDKSPPISAPVEQTPGKFGGKAFARHRAR